MSAPEKARPKNPTANYYPRASNLAGISSYYYDGKPWYSYYHAPRMRRDPFVNWLLDLWQYPFQQVKFQIRTNSVGAQAFIQKTLQKFWSRYLPVVLKNYCCYGFSPAGFEYTVKAGLWRLNVVTPVQPMDIVPHVYTGSTKFAGFAIPGMKGIIASPYAFYFCGYEEMGRFYDRPPLAGVYDPWLEANGRGGAKDLRQLLMRKYAIPPRVIYHPSGTVTMVDAAGNEIEGVQYADIAMAAAEYMESGSNIAIVGDRDDKGNRKIEIEPMQSGTDSPAIREYPNDLKKEMAAGMGIPLEVIEAAESGSGYSGRKIPYFAWLGKADQMSGLVIEAFDAAIRPVVGLNFGPKVDYEITPMSLVDAAKKEDQPGGDQGDGQAIGGDQGGGGSPKPGLVPYNGPHGGHGYKNPQTGRVSYGMSATEAAHPAAAVAERVKTLVSRGRFDEAKHPRGDDGKFIDKELIKAAKKSVFVAEGIRRKVNDPAERAKLEKLLTGKKEKGKSADNVPEDSRSTYGNNDPEGPIHIDGKPLRNGDLLVHEFPKGDERIVSVAHAFRDNSPAANGSTDTRISIKSGADSILAGFRRPPSEVVDRNVRRATLEDFKRLAKAQGADENDSNYKEMLASFGSQPVNVNTHKQEAEAQLTQQEAAKFDKEAERLKKAEGRAKHAAGIIREVHSRGGLDPDSHAFKARYGTRKDAIENGIPPHILRKGGQPLDTFADELANSGAIYVPDDRHAEDVLLEMIQNREAHGHAGFEAQEIAGQRDNVEAMAEQKRQDAEEWAKRAKGEKAAESPAEDDSFDVGSFEIGEDKSDSKFKIGYLTDPTPTKKEISESLKSVTKSKNGNHWWAGNIPSPFSTKWQAVEMMLHSLRAKNARELGATPGDYPIWSGNFRDIATESELKELFPPEEHERVLKDPTTITKVIESINKKHEPDGGWTDADKVPSDMQSPNRRKDK